MSARSGAAAACAATTLAAVILAAPLPPIVAAAADPQLGGVQIQSPQRIPAAPPAAPPTGTASVTVTVTTEDGFGIKGAMLVLFPVSPGAATVPGGGPAGRPGQTLVPDVQAARDGGRSPVARRQARTGAGGVATFTGLPGGDYAVGVSPPTGYVAIRAASVSSRVQVRNGGQARVTVKLGRAGVVTGRVLDEDGDPVTGAYVQVFRMSAAGRAQRVGSGMQPTNDLGVYRAWSLPPGDYIVSTSYEDRQGPPDDNAGPVDGYLPTYFPGVVSYDSARTVQVRAGQETGGVDIQLVRGRLGSVTGRVADSAGGSIGPGGAGTNASVILVSRGRNPAVSGRGGGMRPDGTFVISNVPAGDYYISAMLTRGGGSPAVREGAYLPITVNGDEVSVSLQTNLGATISGRVVVEGTPPAQQAGAPGSAGRQAPIRVGARLAIDGGSPAFATGDGQASGTVRPDGTFTLGGVRGPVQIAASGGSVALKAVRRGASDLSGQVMELLGTERVDDIVVVVTYDMGGIQGTILDESDEPLAGAGVLVVPDDPDKWNPGSPFVRQSRAMTGSVGGAGAAAARPGVSTATQVPADSQVTFQMTQLAPGRYLVLGFADSTLMSFDRQWIERCRELGTVVTVDAGQTAVVKVRAIK